MMVRFFLILTMGVLVHGALWFASSLLLKNAVQEWVQRQNDAGFSVQHDEDLARITGYPFNVSARLQNVVLAPVQGPLDQAPWVWRLAHVDLVLSPWPFLYDTLKVDLNTTHTIRFGPDRYRAQAKVFEGKLDWTTSSFLPDDLQITIEDLILQQRTTGEKRLIKQIRFDLQDGPQDQKQYRLEVRDLTLFRPLIGLGARMDEALVRGFISQQSAISHLQPEQVSLWRDQGGVVELERFMLQAGSFQMQGNGTLALDGDLQPVGAFNARFQGFFQIVDRLARAGVISGPNATLAKVMLGALAKRPQNGGPMTLSLPLSLQDRTLIAGPVRLITFDKINW